jgi:ubiquinone/menaquinone biosynthesis C-methylase UbiE
MLRRVMEDVAALIGNRANGRVLVDFGCGSMPYRPLFERHGFEYIGADLEGNEWADCTVSNTGRVDIEDASCDVVLSSQVLEHVPDSQRYLTEAFRVLKPGGWLVLSTHGVWCYHPDPQDFWRWTSDGLRKHVEDNGFVIETWQPVMGPAATALQLFQDATYSLLPRVVRCVYFFTFQILIQFFDVITSEETKAKDACVYVLTARRT